MDSITLQTHSVYPEIVSSVNGNWEAKLITRSGEVLRSFHGRVPTEGKSYLEIRELITKDAYLVISKVAARYATAK